MDSKIKMRRGDGRGDGGPKVSDGEKCGVKKRARLFKLGRL